MPNFLLYYGRIGVSLIGRPDMDRVAAFWDAFWVGESDRPIVWATCVREGKEKKAEALRPHYPTRPDEDFKKIAQNVAEMILDCMDYVGETVPAFVPSFGPDQHGGFLGAKINYSPSSDSTDWSEPLTSNVEELLPLTLKEDNSFLSAMDRYISALAEAAAGRFVVANLDMHSNIDALSALCGPENICMDMLERPEVIERALGDVNRSFVEIYKRYYKLGNMAQTGTSAWLPAYSTKKYTCLASDFICLLSPATARKFIIPALEVELSAVDHALFHLDGPGALPHLDDILSLKKLRGIQWVPGAGAEEPGPAWFDLYKRILGAGKALWVYGEPEMVKVIHKELKSPNVIYNTWGTKSEVESLVSWLKKNKG